LKKDAARTEKLAKALKDNLKRRKAQARARGAPEPPSEDQPQKGPNAAKNPE